jgi:hypothetical protein
MLQCYFAHHESQPIKTKNPPGKKWYLVVKGYGYRKNTVP